MTVTVYVAETDNPDAPFAINTREDMLSNYRELVADGNAEPGDFDGYVSSWTALDMPADVHNSPADQAWVAATLHYPGDVPTKATGYWYK